MNRFEYIDISYYTYIYIYNTTRLNFQHVFKYQLDLIPTEAVMLRKWLFWSLGFGKPPK